MSVPNGRIWRFGTYIHTHIHTYTHNTYTYTGVLISPLSDLLPDLFCLKVRIFRLMLVLFYIQSGAKKKYTHSDMKNINL